MDYEVVEHPVGNLPTFFLSQIPSESILYETADGSHSAMSWLRPKPCWNHARNIRPFSPHGKRTSGWQKKVATHRECFEKLLLSNVDFSAILNLES